MKLAKYETETVLLSKAMEAVGKTFGEIDKTGRMLNKFLTPLWLLLYQDR